MTEDELAKDLGLTSALTIGIGTMIGAGIFVLPGPAVARAGSLAIVAFLIGGAVALITAFSVAELGTTMPKSGGMYFYINRSLGPLFGSIAGWGNWLGLAFASAFYMIGFGAYVSVFLGFPTLDLVFIQITSAQVWGLIGGLFFISVNYIGAKETGSVQNIIVLTLLAILGGFAFIGFLNADFSSLTPIESMWYSELMPVTAMVFVSYLGFGQIASVGEEIKNPSRNLPIAIIGSVLIVTVLYGLLMLAMLAAVRVDVVANNETAAVDVARLLMEPYGLGVVAAAVLVIGGLLATASSANASILASSRINFAMGRDKLVSPLLNEIHSRFATPYRSIALTGALILVFVSIGGVEPLATAGSVLHLIIFALINAGLVVMREAEPEEYNPSFRVPFYPVTPIFGAVLSLALIFFMSPIIIAVSVVFVLLAMTWYLVYVKKRTPKQGVLFTHVLKRQEDVHPLAVSAAEAVKPEGEYRVMVPIANPETEEDLIKLGGAIAKHKGGKLIAVHVIKIPDQTPLEKGREEVMLLDEDSRSLSENAERYADEIGVELDMRTIYTHKSVEKIFEAARQYNVDLALMGWGGKSRLTTGRAEPLLTEISREIPCDFLIFKDKGLNPSDVLLPTAGGPDSELCAEIAKVFQDTYDSKVRLMNCADTKKEAQGFLEEWSAEVGLENAELVPKTGNVETAIEDEAKNSTMILIGAVGEGMISRLISKSLVLRVLYDVDISVLIAEKKRRRSLWEKLFG